jgi:TrwC relaxase
MLRVTTLHASSAAATAAYYAQYLTAAPGEVPGVWSGRQALGLGLSGRVEVDALESLLSGRDPTSGTPLGRELLDRYTTDGRVVRAVSGFDATFSAPKSLSVWWALGGLYQSVLRAELAHSLGVDWRPIVNGQAEIAGIPDELLAVFSKRTADIDTALADKLDDFRQREGRDPSRWERAALTREASADTRSRKSGHGATDLTTRWQTEAAAAGWTGDLLDASIDDAATHTAPSDPLIVPDVIETVSQQRSSWTRADVLQTICDLQGPVSQ